MTETSTNIINTPPKHRKIISILIQISYLCLLTAAFITLAKYEKNIKNPGQKFCLIIGEGITMCFITAILYNIGCKIFDKCVDMPPEIEYHAQFEPYNEFEYSNEPPSYNKLFPSPPEEFPPTYKEAMKENVKKNKAFLSNQEVQTSGELDHPPPYSKLDNQKISNQRKREKQK